MSNIVNLNFNSGSGSGGGGSGITFAQLTGASGYLQSEINTVSGLATGAGGVSFAQLTGASGVLRAYTNTVSGLISGWTTGQLANYATIGYVTGASGWLQGEINSLSGLLTGSYATFAQLTGASGTLHTYTNTMSGIISGWVTGWVASHAATGGGVTLSDLTGASGYLQSEINIVSGIAVAGGGGGPLFALRTPIFISNTENFYSLFTGIAGEATGIGSNIIDPSFWQLGKSIQFKAKAFWGTSATPPSHQFDLNLNGATFGSIAVNDLSASLGISGNFPGVLEYHVSLNCVATGAAGALAIDGSYGNAFDFANARDNWNLYYLFGAGGILDVDLTTGFNFDVQFKMDTNADPDNVVNFYSVSLVEGY